MPGKFRIHETSRVPGYPGTRSIVPVREDTSLSVDPHCPWLKANRKRLAPPQLKANRKRLAPPSCSLPLAPILFLSSSSSSSLPLVLPPLLFSLLICSLFLHLISSSSSPSLPLFLSPLLCSALFLPSLSPRALEDLRQIFAATIWVGHCCYVEKRRREGEIGSSKLGGVGRKR